MRVAALYDVHGMPWALEAVLREVEEEQADLTLFGGDLIGGPEPERALALARSVEARFIRGNAEREPGPWDLAQLDGDDVRWLAELPGTLSLDGVLYCHATPRSDTEIVTAVTPDEVLQEAFAGAEEALVVCGHTHHQYDRRVGDLHVVNAGSVGMPYEGDVAAFWTLVEDGRPQFRRTSIDVERAAAEIQASGWPDGGEFVAENVLAAPSREEAIAFFEARR